MLMRLLLGGKMILNRFCIDEENAFELSGVNYLRESSFEIKYAKNPSKNSWKPLERYQPYQPWERRKVKGKGVFILAISLRCVSF